MATKKQVKKAAVKKPTARKAAGRKPTAKGKMAAKAKPAPRPAKKVAKAAPAKGGSRLSWLDGASHKPLIDRYARQLKSFLDAVADGVVEEHELAAQEGRLVKLMKDVEPKLSGELHAKVTELLCELTAYDIMQMMHAMCENRPKSVFQG